MSEPRLTKEQIEAMRTNKAKKIANQTVIKK
jgi:hypothetical protein